MRACAVIAVTFLAALHSPQVLGELNASAEHGTYEAADLSAASRVKAEGQELQDLLHWAICERPARRVHHVLVGVWCSAADACFNLDAAHSDAGKLRERAEQGESLQEALARRHNVQQVRCKAASSILQVLLHTR